MSDRPTSTDTDDDLVLLTAKEAAKLLHVDPSTFVRIDVYYLKVGKSKRYTKKLLRAWQDERAIRCQTEASGNGEAPRKFRGSNIYRNARAGQGSKSTSLSEVIDLGKALGLRTKPQQQRTR